MFISGLGLLTKNIILKLRREDAQCTLNMRNSTGSPLFSDFKSTSFKGSSLYLEKVCSVAVSSCVADMSNTLRPIACVVVSSNEIALWSCPLRLFYLGMGRCLPSHELDVFINRAAMGRARFIIYLRFIFFYFFLFFNRAAMGRARFIIYLRFIFFFHFFFSFLGDQTQIPARPALNHAICNVSTKVVEK